MLSKTVMFRLMNLRMRILSSPPPSPAAAAVGIVAGRRGAHITLHLPSLVDSRPCQAPMENVNVVII